MRCLWITRQYPRPADSGELIYSKGLLTSLAACADFEITVLTYASEKNPIELNEIPSIRYVVEGPVPARKPKDLLSPLPSDASRLASTRLIAKLQELLREDWDALIIDQAACGWVLHHHEKLPPLVYLSHNHEAVIRPQIAESSQHPWYKKILIRSDAKCYALLEEQLIRRASLVTTITLEDAEEFQEKVPQLNTVVLTPGYEQSAREAPSAEALAARARRVILTGSFQWIAKARNLEEFLSGAHPVFPKNGIELSVVGKCDPSYFTRLSQRFPWVSFHPNVPTIEPYLQSARIGVLPDTLGGGFKLKALDYIFHGLPLAAVSPSLRGLPPQVCERVIRADTPQALAEAIAERIDETTWLSESATQTLASEKEAYSWQERGERLAAALRDLPR